MSWFYPYNEILPTYKAHDTFILEECEALRKEGVEITLAYGRGSLPWPQLQQHYGVYQTLEVHPLPILRRNCCFPFSWNFPFFYSCQRLMRHHHFPVVMLSVLKQAMYHIQRKIPGSLYIYQVHELSTYPNTPQGKHFLMEQSLLNQVDAIITTTEALKDVLLSLYRIRKPITVVPLAAHLSPLPIAKGALQLAYVGQLYREQGLYLLLDALHHTEGIHLTIVGGTPHEIVEMQAYAQQYGLLDRVTFTGFVPPSKIETYLQSIHYFVAPFLSIGKMRYVAHTKLTQYVAWQKPVIAPDLPVVREHLGEGHFYFAPDDVESLTTTLRSLPLPPPQIEGGYSWSHRAKKLIETVASLS